MIEVNNELGGLSTDHNTDQKSPENEEVDWSITTIWVDCEFTSI